MVLLSCRFEAAWQHFTMKEPKHNEENKNTGSYILLDINFAGNRVRISVQYTDMARYISGFSGFYTG